MQAPKSEALKQAQIAAFAAEAVPDSRDADVLYRQIGVLATAEAPQNVMYVTDRDQRMRGGDGTYDNVPAGTHRKAAAKDDYLAFLRASGGSRYESVRVRAEVLERWPQFAPAVAELKQDILAGRAPAPLGYGDHSIVYPMRMGDEEYAVRMSRSGRPNPLTVDRHLAGEALRRGRPNMERIATADYDEGITVAERAPGKVLNSLNPEELKRIPDAHLRDLVDALEYATSVGIQIDFNPGNFPYDRERGFTILDSTAANFIHDPVINQVVGQAVGYMGFGFANIGESLAARISTMGATEYKYAIALQRAKLDLTERYMKLVKRRFAGREQEYALWATEASIEMQREAIKTYSTRKVKSQVRANEKRMRAAA